MAQTNSDRHAEIFFTLCALAVLLGAVSGQQQVTCRIEPQQQQVSPGSLAIFTCRCTGIIQEYTWRRANGAASLEPGRHSLFVNADQAGLLVLYRTQASDAGSYVCVGTTTVGTGRNQATLSITGVTTGPRLTAAISPAQITRPQGGSVTFTCSITPESSDMQYSWSWSGGSLPSNGVVLLGGNSLFLYQLLPSNTGTYTCSASLPSSPGSSITADASLLVTRSGQIPTERPQATLPPATRPPPAPRTFPPAPTIPPATLSFPVNVVPLSSIRRPGNASFMVCNYQLPAGFSVESIQWSRADGTSLPFRRTQQYTCNSVLYVYDLARGDSGFYSCQVNARNAFGRTAVSQGISNIRVVNLQVTLVPAFTSATTGERASLQCRVNSELSSEAQFQWSRMHGKGIPRSAVAVGSRLTLSALHEDDTGEYCCSATVGSETTQTCAEILVGDGCIRKGEFMRKGSYNYFNTSEIVRTAQVRPAADIIMLIDESRSMILEHGWLQDISIGLDQALKANGFGVDIPNQFGLVGFAKDNPDHVRGRVFPMSACDGSLMGTAEEFNAARENLALDGRKEDLYHAMELALDRYPLRPGQACQIIGITDEGRTPQDPYISYQSILAKMRAKGCMLNVIVNQKMQSTHTQPASPALGVSANNDSAVEMEGGRFQIFRGKGRPVVQTAHGSTHVDYTRLAFDLGGAAWDLNRLRDGGNTAAAFTKAFINLKVREISRQLCEKCFCDLGPRPDCTDGCVGEPPKVYITGPTNVTYGAAVYLECTALGDPIPELLWQPLENNPGLALPPNNVITPVSDALAMRVRDVQSSFCVECNGTNLEGFHVEQHCVTVLREDPKVFVSGTHNGNPVLHGGQVTLQCTATAGIPEPALRWQKQPLGSTVRTDGKTIFLDIPRLTQDECIHCVGTSVLGSDTVEECVRVEQILPEVMISGSYGNTPRVVIGTAVELTCVAVVGIPTPTLRWATQLPAATTRTSGGVIIMSIPAVLERTCVQCVGSNAVGDGTDEECIDVESLPPQLNIAGTHNGNELTFGDGVTLRCTPIGGVPFPEVSWGSNLPPNAVVTRDGNVAVLQLTNILERTCVTCVGTSLAGDRTVEECINVGGEIPTVEIQGTGLGPGPIIFGTGVSLQCVVTGGRPTPTLRWENAPSLSNPSRSGSAITVRYDNPPLGRTCFVCVGSNPAGDGRDEKCINVIGEVPVVAIQGSNNGRPVVIGSTVSLRCVEVSGVPKGRLAWSSALPAGAVSSVDGSAILLTIPSVLQRACVTCVSTNAVGPGTADECVDVTSVPPQVTVTGSNNGGPVNFGSSLELLCIATAGTPSPQLSWLNLPAGAVESRRGSTVVLSFADLRQRVCATCVGTSLAGRATDEECVDVRSLLPEVEITGGSAVNYGEDIRLECRPVAGIPFPTASWEDKPPNGAQVTRIGNAAVITLTNLRQRTCVKCYGRSIAGRVTEEECIDVLSELPNVVITGTNNRQPVPRDSSVTLQCRAEAGIPAPQLNWEVVGGGALPQNARSQRSGDRITLEFTSFNEDICVRCVGTNAIGRNSAEECVKLGEEPPVVRISGSGNGLPYNPGDSVILECEPLAGNPDPVLTWRATGGQQLPTTITRVGDKLLLEVESVASDFCVTCIGTNSAGTDAKQHCVQVQREAPRVSLIGSNKGQPLNEGGAVDLTCIPISGLPLPTVVIQGAGGRSLPPGAIVRVRGNGSFVSIPGVEQYVCVECVGTNSEGSTTEKVCLDVLGTCPHPENAGQRVFHGASARRFSTEPGNVIVRVPGSAVIAFVIDESGSMRGEHEWLRSTMLTFEDNLRARGIGSARPNQYALVGFGHPDISDSTRERGKVLLGDRATGGCQSAASLRSALDTMYVDGRLEDGYSAAGIAMDQVECLQRPRPQNTACQIILATDEGRDVLSRWNNQSILDQLRRYDCVLNVVVWERMRGRISDAAPWQAALGVSASSGAVIARDNDQFFIAPQGEALKQSGHEETHEDYVKIALATGGAAWDLRMLRTERYRQSFTNGFIEVKIQEIERQIVGVCEDCMCRNGTNDCRRLSRNFGKSSCLNPVPNVNLGVSASPEQRLLEPGQQAEFTCNVNSREPVSVSWYPQRPETLVRGNRLIITNVTATRDDGTYTCRAVGEDGYNEARIQLTVDARVEEPEPPFRPVLPGEAYITTSLESATVNQEVLFLTCCVRRSEGDVIEWHYNTDRLGRLPARVSVDVSGRLVFNPVLRTHAGEYECVHKTSGGTSFDQATLRDVGGQLIAAGVPRQCRP